MSLYIIQELHSKKLRSLGFDTDLTDDSIAYIDKNNKIQKYITLEEDGDMDNIAIQSKDKAMIIPLIPITDENVLIFINGQSGNGKSLFAYNFARQYSEIYEGEIFYVSNKRKEVDQNMKNIDCHQLNLGEIANFDINKYSDSLFLVDDVDNGDIHKPAMHLVNSIANLGREYSVSCVYITHNNSKLQDTRMSKECHLYITFPQNLDDNNIIEKMKITSSTLSDIKKYNSSFVCFNKLCDYIITDTCVLRMYE